jgi:predicted nucleic acid-binding protein
MSRVVLDASAAAGWVLNDDPKAAEMVEQTTLETQFVVPPIWYLEVANVLLKRERQKGVTPEQVGVMLEALGELAVEYAPDPFDADLKRVIAAARPYQLTSYDATYVGLAMQLSLPLCTLDENLIVATERCGVKRWPSPRGQSSAGV